jgi:hypothetical protein
MLAPMKQLRICMVGLLAGWMSGLPACGTDTGPTAKAGAREEKRIEPHQATTTPPGPPASVPIPERTAVAPPGPVLPRPTTLLELDESAYGKTLVVEGKTVFLMTPTAVRQWTVGTPPVETPLPCGTGPTLTSSDIVYWANGAIHAAPRAGGTARLLGTVDRQPQQLVASGDQFAWLDRDPQDKYTVRTLKMGVPQIIYNAGTALTSPIAVAGRVYLIEHGTAGWRIVGIPLRGKGKRVASTTRAGRIPSMLAGKDDIYYYDLPSRSIRRLPLDLSREDTVAEGVVCSPMAVSSRIFCARVEGVFEVPLNGGPLTVLTAEPVGLVTTIAAGTGVVAWLNDTGANHLTLRMLPLSQQ